MDLNRVAVFVRVVDDQGFTAAAKALGLPKSSVSRAVGLLEAELGVRLLQRSTRRVSLTEAGGAFYERASRGLAGVEEAAAAVADMQGALRGAIRMTAPVDAGERLLAAPIARFVRRHPRVHVELVLTGRVVDLVEEGFDLALRAGALRDGSLVARKLGESEGGVFASPRYLARRGTPARVEDLTRHRCVLFRPSRGRATWALTGPDGEERVEVGGPIGADDLSFVRRMLLAGVGLGQLPLFACAHDVARGRLARVLPAYRAFGAPMHLVYPSSRYVPRRVTALRDFLLESFAGGQAAAARAGGAGRPAAASLLRRAP
ncbi:MAG TPA: LysR family transcriptional regulator [Polyangiaceae bacterium]|nr:LysR family transcriptional regulator [Polyangiaceae bacterium]